MWLRLLRLTFWPTRMIVLSLNGSREGENFRALFKMIDYEVLENRGADVKVDRLVAQAGELDTRSVKKRIIGKWRGSVRLEYDYYYTEVCRIHALPGKVYWFPMTPRFDGSYIFHEDGTITHQVLRPGEPFTDHDEDTYVTYHRVGVTVLRVIR